MLDQESADSHAIGSGHASEHEYDAVIRYVGGMRGREVHQHGVGGDRNEPPQPDPGPQPQSDPEPEPNPTPNPNPNPNPSAGRFDYIDKPLKQHNTPGPGSYSI